MTNQDDELRAAFSKMLELVDCLDGQFRKKPMFGGGFGAGDFEIATTLLVDGGLHSVQYFVLHALTSCPIAIATTRKDAVDQARTFLESKTRDRVLRLLASVHQERQSEKAERELSARIAAEEAVRVAKAKLSKPKHIPRRRREIFDKSEGKCHYCGVALTLDGHWHIEHKMPRALMGSNEPSNLVASCAPCNHKKRDKTDVEFLAERAKT